MCRTELSAHGGIVEIRSAVVCSAIARHPFPCAQLRCKYQHSGNIVCCLTPVFCIVELSVGLV